ncbi:MAG TPA: hypothetical protein VL137_10395, partial [Polyangiaceae bacterium]|nr:hypothetical protein [Polyangiaceae bacterium]
MKTRKLAANRLLTTLVWFALLGSGLGFASACGGDSKATGTATGGASSTGTGNGTAGTGITGYNIGDSGAVQIASGGMSVTDSTGTFTCYQITCANHLLECGDCQDTDNDGLIDSHDPECLGPCDNTEGPALTAGVGGETGGPCLADCYFDFGNGPGNDDCHWDHRCDPLSVAPDYHPEGDSCPFDQSSVGGRSCPSHQSDACLNY